MDIIVYTAHFARRDGSPATWERPDATEHATIELAQAEARELEKALPGWASGTRICSGPPRSHFASLAQQQSPVRFEQPSPYAVVRERDERNRRDAERDAEDRLLRER